MNDERILTRMKEGEVFELNGKMGGTTGDGVM